MFFTWGVWAGGAAVAALGAADERTGLALAATLDAVGGTAEVLAFTALAGVDGLGMDLSLATGAVVLEATADLSRGLVLFRVFTSCLLAVSKGRLLTVCPCAADPKSVRVHFKTLVIDLVGFASADQKAVPSARDCSD
jgi:hypothetical protein